MGKFSINGIQFEGDEIPFDINGIPIEMSEIVTKTIQLKIAKSLIDSALEDLKQAESSGGVNKQQDYNDSLIMAIKLILKSCDEGNTKNG